MLVTGGLAGLVYGLVHAAERGWGSPQALLVLVVSVVLLLAFVRLQAVRTHALVPTRLLRNPTVLGGDLVGLVLGAAIYGLFYTRTSNLLAAGVPDAEAVTTGWSLGFVVCVALVLAGLLITLTMIRPPTRAGC